MLTLLVSKKLPSLIRQNLNSFVSSSPEFADFCYFYAFVFLAFPCIP